MLGATEPFISTRIEPVLHLFPYIFLDNSGDVNGDVFLSDSELVMRPCVGYNALSTTPDHSGIVGAIVFQRKLESGGEGRAALPLYSTRLAEKSKAVSEEL
jgi:hypothetical protein